MPCVYQSRGWSAPVVVRCGTIAAQLQRQRIRELCMRYDAHTADVINVHTVNVRCIVHAIWLQLTYVTRVKPCKHRDRRCKA